MQLPNSFSQVAETLLKLPQAKIAKCIGLVLLIYIAYILAKITWLFIHEPVPQHDSNFSNSIISQNKSSSQSYNLTAIKTLNLFGIYNQTVAIDNEPEDIEDAPETNLNLTLTGVVASDDEKLSAAIIANNGVQEIYAIDESINGTRAVLKKVHNDRVHIRHSGRLETLMLDGFEYTQTSNSNKPRKVKPAKKANSPLPKNKQQIDNRNNQELANQAKALRNDIDNDPGKITDYLRINPKRKNGKIIGYQLRPGKKPEFFKSSGLKSGDIAIQMNGFDLTQPLEAAQALQALKQEQEISLLVNRNDDITEILFSINGN